MYDFAIIAVGLLASLLWLLGLHVLLERRNSGQSTKLAINGVIHSGIYYKGVSTGAVVVSKWWVHFVVFHEVWRWYC